MKLICLCYANKVAMKSIRYLGQWTHFIVILSLALGVSGCGFYSDEPVEDQDIYRPANLEAKCKLNTDQFGQILEQDISGQIKCLQENFRQFLLFVRTDVPDSVGSTELERFIEKFFRANSETMIKSLGLLFELNTILLRDEVGQISRDSIDPLFRLLVVANKEAVTITKTIREMTKEGNEARFWELREELKASIERFSSSTSAIITGTGKLPRSLNIRKFILDLNDRLQDFDVDAETVDCMLFLKRLFVGGNKSIITSTEVETLLRKFPKMIMVAIDLFFTKEKNFETKNNRLRFYSEKVFEVEALLAPVPKNEILFSTSDIFKIIATFASDDFDLATYRELIYGFKEHLIGGGRENYNFGHLLNAFAYLKIGLEGLMVVNTYNDAKEIAKSDKDVQKLENLRDVFAREVESLAQKTRNLIAATPTLPESIGVKALAQTVNRDLYEQRLSSDFIEAAFAAKTLLIGGERDKVTLTELTELTGKITETALLLYDFILLRPNGDRELFNFTLPRFLTLKKLLKDLPANMVVLTNDDIVALLREVVAEDVDVAKFLPALENFKGKILGGDKKHYTSGDFKGVLAKLQRLLENLAFNTTTYAEQSELLSLNIRLAKIPDIWHEEYKYFSKARLIELRREFNELIARYKFLREPKSGNQFYSHSFLRSSRGFTELAVVKWAADLVALGYGKLMPGKTNQYRVDMEATNTILYDYKPILEELGLWSKSPETFARNMLLLSDLFTLNSDGDYHISVPEITEYGPLVITAMKLGDELINELEVRCGSEPGEERPLIAVPCSREHFFDVLLNKLGQKTYMPHLASYIHRIDLKTRLEFLSKVEGFARDIKDDNVPINKREYMLIFGAMLNIESTFLRYDVNRDNQVDADELKEAFKTYRQAIIDIAKLDESKVKYSESIFLYLIKYMEIPSTTELLWFHYVADKSKITAERLNIGAILNFLVSEANSKAHKKN